MVYKSYVLILLILCALNNGEAQNQGGLLWTVIKPGSKDTSYLLGTLHKYPQTVVKLPEIVEEKLNLCNNLYLEMQLDWKMAIKMLTSGTISNAMMIDENENWTEEDWDKIKNWFVNVQQMDERDFERLKANGSGSRLVDMYLKLYGYTYGAVEDDLKMMARKKRITIKGLDKDWNEIQTWYAHYAKSSSGFWQEGDLDSLLADGYYGLADLFIAYAIQDTATINEHEKDVEWKDGLTLVGWRNKQWMKQLNQLMQQKTFVAVGAAHLYGETGVIRLLENAGFKCLPVKGHFGGDKLERFVRRNSRQYQLVD